MHGQLKKIFRFGAIGLLSALSTSAFASGYKMEFQSASVLADGGDAAVVDDASTNWYNSAGLVMLPQQLVASSITIYDRTQFTGSVTAPNNVGGAAFGPTQGTANSRLLKPLPAFHYSLPIKDRFAIGLSVVPAWGLAEDYGTSAFTRYELTRIYTKTIDIAPSIAVKINDKWSVGAGPDINYFEVQERFNINTAGGAGGVGDSVSRISADAWDTGWHAGLLFRPNDCTRVGVNYRSKIVMNMTGTSGLFGLPVGIVPVPENRSLTIHWVLPPTTSLSAYRDLNSKWAIMGTLAYDQWSTLRTINVQNYQSTGTPGRIPVSLAQGFRNTLDVSVGTHFKLNEKWLLRGSVKYEPTPTGDVHRDIGFPTGDVLGINLGGHYKINCHLGLDVIYGHVFTKNTAIRPTPITNAATGATLTGVTINGHSSTAVDLLGAQIVWSI